jgi:hypothetical protein
MQQYLSTRKSPELVSPYIQIPNNVNTFNFDTYLIDECFVLKNIAGYILKTCITEISIELDEICLTKFIGLVCENYNKNHFHNFQHAVNVLQMTYILLKETNIINKLQPHIVFSALISALSHDVDHPGNTNSYEINSMSKYAKLYNDISVLENHHASLTFELLERSGLIDSFNNNFRESRKTIITCILGTDMSKHNEILNKFEQLDFAKDNFTSDEQILIASCFLHFADLSNPIKNFDIYIEWSKRISLEFYEQTIKEASEGLPILSFMKVNDKLSLAVNEINFITHISIPIWNIFVTKFEKLNFITNNINDNLSKWREIEQKYLADNDINNLNY